MQPTSFPGGPQSPTFSRSLGRVGENPGNEAGMQSTAN